MFWCSFFPFLTVCSFFCELNSYIYIYIYIYSSLHYLLPPLTQIQFTGLQLKTQVFWDLAWVKLGFYNSFILFAIINYQLCSFTVTINDGMCLNCIMFYQFHSLYSVLILIVILWFLSIIYFTVTVNCFSQTLVLPCFEINFIRFISYTYRRLELDAHTLSAVCLHLLLHWPLSIHNPIASTIVCIPEITQKNRENEVFSILSATNLKTKMCSLPPKLVCQFSVQRVRVACCRRVATWCQNYGDTPVYCRSWCFSTPAQNIYLCGLLVYALCVCLMEQLAQGHGCLAIAVATAITLSCPGPGTEGMHLWGHSKYVLDEKRTKSRNWAFWAKKNHNFGRNLAIWTNWGLLTFLRGYFSCP